MKKVFFVSCLFLFAVSFSYGQHVKFEEYDLKNGLHVILHQDKSAPVMTTSVMYHVGSKDEVPGRTGFAHFFEHLLFEGTVNIKRGEWFKIVGANGGQNNANTSDDRTYYYETFPSNKEQLGLWMESERMLHPVINQIGVNTQREVVKEEKRMRIDNRPYGQIFTAVKENIFKKHPYRWPTIGSMDDINAAKLEEFRAFHDKFYIPNNAVLVVAGDIDVLQTKKWIEEYFSDIPKKPEVVKEKYLEDPIVRQINASYHDPNIQIPMLVNAYRIPSMKQRDAYVLNLVSAVLSDGKSSRLYKRMVDEEKTALEVGSFAYAEEDYGTYFIYALPMTGKTLADLQSGIDDEIKKITTDLISEREYQKIQNSIENTYVNANLTTEGIAENLATYYLLYGNTDLINKELDLYKSISREEIRAAAKKYLNPDERLVLDYLPEKK